MNDPLRFEFEVGCPAEHAFATWTERTSTWWPSGSTMSGLTGVQIVFEPRVGGRIFERTPDGTEHDWGRITAWDPPRRLAYRWHHSTDPASATDVEIRFADAGRSKTRVEVVHSGWERLRDRADAWRDRNQGGWNGVIPIFIAACDAT